MPRRASAAPADFGPVFAGLRRILKPHAKRLVVIADTPTRYGLAVRMGPTARRIRGPRAKNPIMPVAWIETCKGYISYHLMPVYCLPALAAGISPALKSHQQGRACFNFKAMDTKLFGELQDLTDRGIADFKAAGLGE